MPAIRIHPALRPDKSQYPVPCALESDAKFKIFFLCEDFQAFEQAAALKSRLDQNCQDQIGIEACFVEYAKLCHFRLRKTATELAMDSDMIIISAKGTDPVPAFVQTWLDELGNLVPEKIVCGEFLAADHPDEALHFHKFVDGWASRKNSVLFSNLFPAPMESMLAEA